MFHEFIHEFGCTKVPDVSPFNKKNALRGSVQKFIFKASIKGSKIMNCFGSLAVLRNELDACSEMSH